jgi:DNA-binding NtrC family response regulator
MKIKDNLIFIVEDDIQCGKLILYFLKRHGFRNVVLFTNGRDCLDNMRQQPDILITDFRLKNTNGLELIRDAKKIHPDFYCILLSGMHHEEFSSHEITKKYVDKYIMKGCTGMEELLLTLNNWLHIQYVEHYY